MVSPPANEGIHVSDLLDFPHSQRGERYRAEVKAPAQAALDTPLGPIRRPFEGPREDLLALGLLSLQGEETGPRPPDDEGSLYGPGKIGC